MSASDNRDFDAVIVGAGVIGAVMASLPPCTASESAKRRSD